MDFKDYLNRFDIPSIKSADAKLNDLKSQIYEMGQLKSDFDCEKFTVAKQGDFIAHQFHFLMRQYAFSLYESKRMLIDREEKLRELSRVKAEDIDADLKRARIENDIYMLELNLCNKLAMNDRFEQLRLKLIEQNGKEFTNKQFQLEEPGYWKWFIQDKARNQLSARQTGIEEGTWEVVRQLEAKAPITPEFQLNMKNDSNQLLLE